MDYRQLEKPQLQASFERFAEKECSGVSPFYTRLSREIAQDESLLDLAAYSRQGQPIPNLFLAAVHFLLLKDPKLPLAAYYPSIQEEAKPTLSMPLFKAFCLEHYQEIIQLLQTKIVQTNAINRAAYLMPVIFSLFKDESHINVVDIGCSAGLTLNFDHYEYDYSTGEYFGSSPVRIESEIRGGKLPAFSTKVRINRKTGIDQNPLNLQQEENARWLQALIWPDRKKRFTRMERAIELAKTSKVNLVEASAVDTFKEVLLQQESELPIVVYHTHVLYQFSPADRLAFWQMLDEVGAQRQMYYLAAEAASILPNSFGHQGILVTLTTYHKGNKDTKLVAQTNGHAHWISWK